MQVDRRRLGGDLARPLQEREEALRGRCPQRPFPAERALHPSTAQAASAVNRTPINASSTRQPAALPLVRYPMPVPGTLKVVYRRPREETPVWKPRIPTE